MPHRNVAMRAETARPASGIRAAERHARTLDSASRPCALALVIVTADDAAPTQVCGMARPERSDLLIAAQNGLAAVR